MALSAISRRAVLSVFGCAVCACHSKPAPSPAEAESAEAPPAEAFGGLQFATGGELGEHDHGGTTIVLLHGFGASGDDLISLARSLSHPHARYIVPAAPIELPNGGRAWWPMHGHPTYNEDQVLVVASDKLETARTAVQGLLSTIHERFAPDSLFLIGFSQGAMLALDVALGATSGVERVAVLSGALLDDAAALLEAPHHASPSVFVSHGRQDPVLRFQGAQQLVSALKARDIPVKFQPFDGGHEIPPATVEDLKAFLFGT